MASKKFEFEYQLLESAAELDEADQALLELAKQNTRNAYAPYSHFYVAAAAKMSEGQTLAATNQENASYPVGICAERTLLSAISSVYPGQGIDTIAITYVNHANEEGGNQPASPCGICRQSLLEFEQRTGRNIRLILAGKSGPVMILNSAKNLLPFGFGPDDLKGSLK